MHEIPRLVRFVIKNSSNLTLPINAQLNTINLEFRQMRFNHVMYTLVHHEFIKLSLHFELRNSGLDTLMARNFRSGMMVPRGTPEAAIMSRF